MQTWRTIMTPEALLAALHLGDSAFPSGAFAFSWGLEGLAADGLVTAEADLALLLEDLFVNRWRGRMINIHPSLLPAYRGLHTHQRVLADGVAEHGCTVHFVEPELDAGPIIAQARVPVAPADDAETLAARVLAEEHRIYPQALAEVAAKLALEHACGRAR